MAGVLASGRRCSSVRLRPGRPRGRAVRREDARCRPRPGQPPPPWGASSRLSCPCWRDRQRDPGRPALPRGGRGRETEQGMAQGQPGRPPPGHARRAPRHFVRDAVVFEDYTIAEGMVIPQGAPRTRYHPETCPALPQQLARLARGDTTRRLGLCPDLWLVGLCAAGGRRRPWRAQRRGGGSPGLDLGPGRDGRVVPAPDVWAPGRGRCRAAAQLTGRAAPAATADRRRPTADCPRGLGSAAGPHQLGVAAAQPRGLADVCPRHAP